ncbi:MAG TPA: hypothetical protein VFP72_14175 [Kineosporiaceae bacterium]|nr:hypothetical protein [Kineosporiaceae bacterium]
MNAAGRSLVQAVPLVAIDDVVACEGDGHVDIVATAPIRANEPYLAGHYPGRPIYPGVFVIEAVRQSLARYLEGQAARRGELWLEDIESVHFSAPLFPPETLRLAGRCEVSGTSVCAAFRGVNNAGQVAARLRARFRWEATTGD